MKGQKSDRDRSEKKMERIKFRLNQTEQNVQAYSDINYG